MNNNKFHKKLNLAQQSEQIKSSNVYDYNCFNN